MTGQQIEGIIVDQIRAITAMKREVEAILLSEDAGNAFTEYCNSLMTQSADVKKRNIGMRVDSYLGIPVKLTSLDEFHLRTMFFGGVTLPVIVTMAPDLKKAEDE